jgi:hypothetical protein
MFKVFKVTSKLTPLNTPAILTDKAIDIINRYNNSDCQLFLNVFASYQNDTLDDILDQGMYDYEVKGSDKNLCDEAVTMLIDLSDRALPYYIDEDDIVIVQ